MFKSIGRIKEVSYIYSNDLYVHNLFDEYLDSLSNDIDPLQFLNKVKYLFNEIYNPAIFPFKLSLRKQIIDEMILYFLIELLYENISSAQVDKYLKKEDILLYNLINPNKEDLLNDEKKVISYNYKKAMLKSVIDDKTSYKYIKNYSSKFNKICNKDFFPTFSKEIKKLTPSIIKEKNTSLDYLQITNLPYLRFLIIEYSNLTLIMNKISTLTYELKKDSYANTLDIFSKNYNELVNSAFDYALHYFPKNEMKNLYIYFYTFYINTRFLEIANISQKLSHKTSEYDHIFQSEKNLLHTLKILKPSKSAKDNKKEKRKDKERIDLNFYDNMTFYIDYINFIFNIHYSPTLCVELIKNPPSLNLSYYFDIFNNEYDYALYQTFRILHKKESFSDFILLSIDYLLKSTPIDIEGNQSTSIISLINDLKNHRTIDWDIYEINKEIIGKNFTGLSFFIFQKYHKFHKKVHSAHLRQK